MKSFAILLAIVASSNALIARRNAFCCFHLSTTGAVTGTVGQLSSGTLREGGSLAPSSFCISNGVIVDSTGRGCVVSPPTNVLQCDTGATGSSPFSIACDGTVSFQGSSVFFECQTGDNSEANIYAGSAGGINCGQITLHADSCMAGCPPPPPPPPPPPGCPGTLSSGFQFPHLIIPVDSSQPNSAPGTSYFGTVSSTVSSIFNFDIPASDAGQNCQLVFFLPTQSQLTTSSFTLSGNGGVRFSKLNSIATQGTTFNNAPGVAVDYGVTTVSPGNSYSIADFACPAGTTISFEMMASGDTRFSYFQDYNPCPIGLYINVS